MRLLDQEIQKSLRGDETLGFEFVHRQPRAELEHFDVRRLHERFERCEINHARARLTVVPAGKFHVVNVPAAVPVRERAEVRQRGQQAIQAQAAHRIRKAVNSAGFPEVDHVELIGAGAPGADSRNFVLCPGLAYDRSPCGTGTSAKLACLAADGKLLPGEPWVQESILGTRFVGAYEWGVQGKSIIPTISGTAHVTAEATLLLDSGDPFRWGIRAD